jgi:iron(III) transport system substrate-binding protein
MRTFENRTSVNEKKWVTFGKKADRSVSKESRRVRRSITGCAVGLVLALTGSGQNQDTLAADGDHAKAKAWLAENAPDVGPSTIDNACGEGVLTIYGATLRYDEVLEAFTNRFPCVKPQLTSMSGGPLAERLAAEYRARQYIADLAVHADPGLASDFVKQGIFEGYSLANGKNVPLNAKKEGEWYGVGYIYFGVAWNTTKVTPEEQKALERIKTWSDVHDLVTKTFKGRTAVVSAAAGGSTQAQFYFFEEKYGLAFLKDIADSTLVVFPSVNTALDRLVAGEMPLIFNATIDGAASQPYEKNAPLQWRYPEPGLGVALAINKVTHAPHPNAATLFAAWSLSPEGLRVWSKGTGVAPVGTTIVDERSFASVATLPATNYPLDWAAISAASRDVVATFRKFFG